MSLIHFPANKASSSPPLTVSLMRIGCGSLLFSLLLISFVGQTSSFDISSWWDEVKNKISQFLHGNATLTEEDLANLKNATTNMTDFRARLKEIRKEINDQLKGMDPVEQEKAREVIKKLRQKVREHIRKTGDNVNEVNEKLNLTGNYYQGDMILTPEQMDTLHPSEEAKKKRQAFGSGYRVSKWETFYYSFAAGLASSSPHTVAVARAALKFWNDNTCIKFVESNTAAARVNIFQGQGCYSYIGKLNRVQELSLGRGCDSVGTAAHEIGHAMGFFHEQSRNDRDGSITLMPNNVQRGWLDQFDKETTLTNNNYGMPYDYGSVMHYAGTSASGNGQPTMVAKVSQYQDTMGSDIVSFRDVSMMNTHYNCKARCPAASSAKCTNGGFPHPRDCSKCLCPSGFGGNLCNERPTGCGASLTAASTPQTLTATVGNGVASINDNYVFCNWMITAPAGKRIEATITSYGRNACTSGCVYGGIELKWRPDLTLTGTRYCCPNDVNEKVTTTGNILPIIGFNRYGRESFSISYRAV